MKIALNIFDTDKWASFFAITDLNYYPHARAAKSVKFFIILFQQNLSLLDMMHIGLFLIIIKILSLGITYQSKIHFRTL